MKIKLMFDSSCGKSYDETIKKGALFVPIIVNLDNKEYKSGVDIDRDYLLKNMTIKNRPTTSAINFSEYEKVINQEIDKVDKIVYISLSKYLSSTNDNAKILSKNEKYKDKFIVIDSNFIAPWIEHYWDFFFELANEGNLEKLLYFINIINNNMYAFISLPSLSFLYAGGRITKAQYIAGNFLKILPIITFDNGDLQKHDVMKTKGYKKCIKKMIEKTKEKIEIEKDCGNQLYKGNNEIVVKVMLSGIDKIDKYLLTEIKNNFDELYKGEIYLSTEIYAHLGPGCFGMGAIPEVKMSDWKGGKNEN